MKKTYSCLSALLFTLVSASFVAAAVQVYPTGVTFPAQATGTTGPVQNVTVYNLGPKAFTVTKVTSSLTAFKIVSGTFPFTIQPNGNETFQVQFTPTSAKTFNGKLSFTFTGAGPQTINLTGLGINTKATPSLSATSLSFDDQALGANGPSKTLTITNRGTVAVSLTNVTITEPFTQTGWTASTTIQPGASFSMQVGYVPRAVGTQAGTLMLTYNIAAPNGVSLWGTAVSPNSLGVTSYPTLPAGTQANPYQANLTAAGGVPPYSWSLSGSTLPSGLTLSSSGVISGTIGSTVTVGNHTVTVNVTDSSTPPAVATSLQTLSVNKITGANCKNTSFNASDGSGPLVPLTDLGTNLYAGSESGGLYANGSNVDDAVHNSFGQGLAGDIQPLDSNGSPSSTGKYVLLGIGLSVTQQSLNQVVPMAAVDPAKNPNLVFVNGATGGGTATDLISQSVFWQAMLNDYLPNAGVTAKQVVAVWFMDVDGGMSGTFPGDMTTLQSQMETIAQMMLTYFPNLKIAYASSIYYTGYSNGIKNLSNEPWTYESGFAVKNMIQDQLNGNSNLNFDSSKGTVVAPWLAWGPYLWANGMLPRSDGTVWACNDLQNDGTHPSTGAKVKVTQQLLNFLKTDETASPWFLAPDADGGKHR
jgi:Putative Ig domain